MARIKISDYGNAAAPPASGARVGREAFVKSDGGLADAALRASSRVVHQQQVDEKRQAEQAERQRAQDEERARRNKAAAVSASYQVDVDSLVTGVGTRLIEGQVNRDDAQKELDDGIAKLKKAHVEPLDAVSREDLSNNVILFDGRARAKFGEVLQRHAKQERIDGFTTTTEALQRLALTERDSAIAQAEVLFKGEGTALLGADRAGKAFQAFKEQAVFVDLDRRISAGQKSSQALAALRGELESDRTADLAPERRRMLEAAIQGHENRLAHVADVAERRRLSTLERQGRRLAWYVENGHQIPGNEYSAFVAGAKGTEFEGFAEELVGTQQALGEFSKLTPPQMIERVKAIEAGYGATPSREQITHLDKIRRFTASSVKLLQDSPLAYAEQRDGAVLERINLAEPASWGANLQHRAEVLSEVSKRTGVAPKGLFPEEAAMLTAVLRDAKPSDKAQMLSMLRQGFGDDRVYRATMQQVAADDPVTASAGLAAARGLVSEGERPIADRILRGQALLRPNKKADGSPAGGKTLPMPGDADLMKLFAADARDAFANNSEAGDLFFQSARAIYAAKADDAGDMSGVLNSSRWSESINEATGGFQKHNGRQIVLPHGMRYSDFRDSLRRRVDHLVAQGAVEGVTASQLMGLPVQNAGDGRYIFRAGDAKLKDKRGRDIVLDFNESAPFVPSGEAPDSRPVTKAGRSSGR